ncbi:MAG: hypothetical protein A2Y12_05520 [Planctomycetes bacterium GWF2_42_9]|nr:MAG: hypothetical protein A2Y12_05520 [Planctomycetes bacterium GWF2_42_9]
MSLEPKQIAKYKQELSILLDCIAREIRNSPRDTMVITDPRGMEFIAKKNGQYSSYLYEAKEILCICSNDGGPTVKETAMIIEILRGFLEAGHNALFARNDGWCDMHCKAYSLARPRLKRIEELAALLQLKSEMNIAKNTVEYNGPAPFPLPDKYNYDDPLLIGEAIDAVDSLHREYMAGVAFFGEQYQIALDVAADIRGAWIANEVHLPGIPQAVNLDCPEKQDFKKLELWFRDSLVAVKADIAKGCEPVRDITLTEPETKVLDYLNDEYPTARKQDDIAAIFKPAADLKTIRKILDRLTGFNLVCHPPDMQKLHTLTSFGRQFFKQHYDSGS